MKSYRWWNAARGTVSALFIGVVSTTALMAFVDTRPADMKAAEWAAAAEEANRLPTSYDEFVALSFARRDAAMERMSADQKSALWREHMRRFEADNVLTAEQKVIVQRNAALLTPEAYGPESPAKDAIRKQVLEICKILPTLFSPEQIAAFKHVGPPAGPNEEPIVVKVVRGFEQALGPGFLRAGSTLIPDCDCTDSFCGSDCNEKYPGSGKVCKDVADNACTRVFDNCGCDQVFTCTDHCELPVAN